MAIKGFDYQEFAKNLAGQAQELVPPEFREFEKQYVINTLYNFSNLAGEALYNDTESNFNIDQAVMITQIIAEWAYHKSVDLIRSGIPQDYWDPIMQKIAFTIFEIAKQTFKQGLPQDQILQLIEHHVKKVYVESIEELNAKGLIDEGLKQKAESQSNIDAMMQQMQEEAPPEEAPAPAEVQPAPSPQPQPAAANVPAPASSGVPAKQGPMQTPKLLKLVTCAMVFQKMKQDKVQTILDKFDVNDATEVIKYMNVDDLVDKVDPGHAMRCLAEIRKSLPKKRIIDTSKIVSQVQSVAEYFDKPKLEVLLKLERPNVKRFVFTALEGEYYEIPPHVAQIIATHLADSV